MASWKFAVGNLVARAPAAPAAVSPAAADSLLPLAQLGSGYPDQQGGLQWRADGAYDIDFDLNLLATSSERADAPTGWYDLLNALAGTPGLPANPPDWGTYAGRTALRLFRPVAQDVEVMPGETVKVTGGLYFATASDATGVEIRVIDLTTGQQWEGTGSETDWTDDGVVALQASPDAWEDFAVEIEADPSHTERRTYRVVVSPLAASFTASTYVYISANGGGGSPALFAAVDTAAIIGHNLPAGATVGLVPQPSGTTIVLAMAQPSSYATTVAAQLVQTWRLSIDIPAALAPSAPRPILGEVWIGQARTMLVGSPVPTFGGEESAPGQLRVEGPRKRVEVVADAARPVVSLELAFRARDDASFRQMRDEVMRLTRFGADPLLLLPRETFEGAGRVYHGRVEDTLSWSVITPTETGSARSFAMPFLESPFAAP
jgi:hypothetical protein